MNKLPAQVNWVYISENTGGKSANGILAAESPRLLRNIKGIIFDFDGTLFDNATIAFRLIAAYPPDILRIWRERLVRKSFAGCDYSSPEEYYSAFFDAFGKACSRSPQRMRNWYYNRYMPRMIRTLKKHYKARPGALELFSQLEANGLQVAIYSDYPFLKERLEALGFKLNPGFRLYGPESFGAQKPAPKPFLSIAGDLGALPEEVLVIGDREDTDGIGAFRAGMRFFCLKTGRKRYVRLDPAHQSYGSEEQHGPLFVMYAGAWENLVKILLNHTCKG